MKKLANNKIILNFGRGKSVESVKNALEAEDQILRYFDFLENQENYRDGLIKFLDDYKTKHIQSRYIEVRKCG